MSSYRMTREYIWPIRLRAGARYARPQRVLRPVQGAPSSPATLNLTSCELRGPLEAPDVKRFALYTLQGGVLVEKPTERVLHAYLVLAIQSLAFDILSAYGVRIDREKCPDGDEHSGGNKYPDGDECRAGC